MPAAPVAVRPPIVVQAGSWAHLGSSRLISRLISARVVVQAVPLAVPATPMGLPMAEEGPPAARVSTSLYPAMGTPVRIDLRC